MKPIKGCKIRGHVEEKKENNRLGKYALSTLYTCLEISQENPFV
jgi:hypothetical protein